MAIPIAAIAGIIGSAASAGGGLIGQYMTNKSNERNIEKTNELNYRINRENLDWQKQQYFDQMAYSKALQGQIFAREDNSYQRTAADLMTAGYSPLAINGTNDAGSVVSMPTAPQLDAAQMQAFQAQSPQFGQLVDVFRSIADLDMEKRRLDIEEQKNLSDTEQKELDRKESIRQFDQDLQTRVTQFNQSLQQSAAALAETNRHNAAEEAAKLKDLTRLNDQLGLEKSRESSTQIAAYVRQIVGDKQVNTVDCWSESEYQEKMRQWQSDYSIELDMLINSGEFDVSSYSSSESFNAAGGISLDAPILDKLGGLNASGGKSKSSSKSTDNISRGLAKMQSWLMSHPLPVPTYKYKY